MNTKNWQPFKIGDIFDLLNGKGITAEEIQENVGSLNAVQSGEEHNGVIGKIDRKYCIQQGYTLTDEPCLTVARSGSAGFVSFQPYGCVVGDSAKILLLKIAKYRKPIFLLFFQVLLTANRFKYTYGRKVTEKKYLNEILYLPTTLLGDIDWEWIKQYMQSINASVHHPKTKNTEKLISIKKMMNGSLWKNFVLSNLFTIKKGKRLTSEDQTEGMTPYIGAIDSNNGISNYIGQSPIHDGNTISLSYNGSVGEAFYQPTPYWATDDVNALYPKFPMNKWIALFICAILRLEKYRFCYGRKWTLEQMNATEIKLPATAEGKPDWAYMESYIKSLPYGDCI